jgi:hypothetical protein
VGVLLKVPEQSDDGLWEWSGPRREATPGAPSGRWPWRCLGEIDALGYLQAVSFAF